MTETIDLTPTAANIVVFIVVTLMIFVIGIISLYLEHREAVIKMRLDAGLDREPISRETRRPEGPV